MRKTKFSIKFRLLFLVIEGRSCHYSLLFPFVKFICPNTQDDKTCSEKVLTSSRTLSSNTCTSRTFWAFFKCIAFTTGGIDISRQKHLILISFWKQESGRNFIERIVNMYELLKQSNCSLQQISLFVLNFKIFTALIVRYLVFVSGSNFDLTSSWWQARFDKAEVAINKKIFRRYRNIGRLQLQSWRQHCID